MKNNDCKQEIPPPDSSFRSAAWYQALSLTERLTSLESHQETTPDVEIDTSLSLKRMRRWHSQPRFTSGAYFAPRLAMDGMSEKEFAYLLGEPNELIRARFSGQLEWLRQLEQAFSSAVCSNLRVAELEPAREWMGFLKVIDPLINQGRSHLRAKIKSLTQSQPDLPF